MTSFSIILFCSVLMFVMPDSYTASVIAKNGPCKPGELVWVECNLCTCNPQGMPNPVCAKMWCQPTPALKEAKANEEARAKLRLEMEKEEELKKKMEEVKADGEKVKEAEGDVDANVEEIEANGEEIKYKKEQVKEVE